MMKQHRQNKIHGVSCDDASNFIKIQDKELQDAKQQLENAINRNNAYLEAIKEAEEKLGFKIKELDDLNDQNDALDQEMSKLPGAREVLRKAIAEEILSHNKTKRKLSEQELANAREIADNNGGLEGLKEQLQKLIDQYDDLAGEHQELIGKHGQLVSDISSNADLLAAKHYAEAALKFEKAHKAEIMAGCDKLKDQIIDVNGKTETFKQNHATILKEMQEIKDGNATKAEKEDLARRLAAEKAAILASQKLDDQTKTDMLKEDNLMIKADNSALAASLETKNNSITQHCEHYDQLKADTETLFQQYTHKLSENTAMNNYLTGLIHSMDAMKLNFAQDS